MTAIFYGFYHNFCFPDNRPIHKNIGSIQVVCIRLNLHEKYLHVGLVSIVGLNKIKHIFPII